MSNFTAGVGGAARRSSATHVLGESRVHVCRCDRGACPVCRVCAQPTRPDPEDRYLPVPRLRKHAPNHSKFFSATRPCPDTGSTCTVDGFLWNLTMTQRHEHSTPLRPAVYGSWVWRFRRALERRSNSLDNSLISFACGIPSQCSRRTFHLVL